MNETIANSLKEFIPALLSFSKMLIVAIIMLVLGFWLIKKLTTTIKRIMEKRKVDETLSSFTLSVVGIALKVLLLISVISYVGIPMTSFVAILGAASLAVGIAGYLAELCGRRNVAFVPSLQDRRFC